ncbi:uncharacterized protein LOC122076973 isoform X3 [Macadamia integrifolia]|uniref:uncharacterized protein LOC122076973 isoform X3 n=1 Tax=Macadamia integrifolia TaxID=60698 RepID=UPI001C5018F9|nr:uncharacterized protein LOC122076973 isoform X3 [Macadamia integrifolia]
MVGKSLASPVLTFQPAINSSFSTMGDHNYYTKHCCLEQDSPNHCKISPKPWIEPVNIFLLISNVWRFRRFPNAAGIEPEIMLLNRSNWLRFSRFPTS